MQGDKNYVYTQTKNIIERPCQQIKGNKRKASEPHFDTQETEMKKLRTEFQDLREIIEKQSSSLEKWQAEAENAKKEKEAISAKLVAKEAEICCLKKDLERYYDLYEKPFSEVTVMQKSEKQIFHDFIEFVDAYNAMPGGTASKVKVIKKQEALVLKYITNTQDLQKTCKYNSSYYEGLNKKERKRNENCGSGKRNNNKSITFRLFKIL